MNLLTRKKGSIFDFEELSKKFLDYIDVSKKTIETYKIALRQFGNYLLNNHIKNPTREDIIAWREELKTYLKPTTVNSYLIAVRSFFQFLSYEDIYKNITENVRGVKLEKRHLRLGLSEEEIKKVLASCQNTKNAVIIKMIFTLGLRENELVNIRLQDFYVDTGIIMLKLQGKGRSEEKQDTIKIDESLFELIKLYVQEYNITDYLFVSDSNRNNGQQITTRAIRYRVKEIFEQANLEYIDLKGCHSLRHSTTEILLKEGISIEEVSQYMRHKNIATTMIYAKELNQKESQCSNILANKLF